MKNISVKIRKELLRFIIITAALCATITNTFASQDDYNSFFSAVLSGTMPVKEIKQSKDIKANECLQKYLKAIPAGSFLLSSYQPAGPEDALKHRKLNLKEQMIVIMGNQAKKEAEAFTLTVPLFLEWEGMSENPLIEADFADNWLRKRPDTSIAPFVYLFMAHRIRAGFEAAKAGREKGLWTLLAARYQEALAKTKSFNHPLISCIADDMEAHEYVYLKGFGRP